MRRPYQGPAVAAKAAGVIKPRTGLDLEIPVHYCVKYGETMRIADNEYSEFQKFMEAVSAVERRFDFIVIVVRNRLSKIGSRNKQLVASGLKDLSLPLGFRAIDGFAERVVYREFFPRGLTALDDLDEATLGTRPSMGHVSAREEVISLLRCLAPRPQGARSSPPGGRPNQRLRRRAESPEPPQEGPPEV